MKIIEFIAAVGHAPACYSARKNKSFSIHIMSAKTWCDALELTLDQIVKTLMFDSPKNEGVRISDN
ncbi:hypothetical protein SCA6_020298 [Theobroma cacao]